MPEFVLVHGGSHGAWCWARLQHELARRNYRAHALDLPGHGQDPTPRAEVTWGSQVDALDLFVRNLDRDDVILVGHSLAGVLIPEVAKRRGDRVRQLVFLASIVLEPGESALDTMDAEVRERFIEMAETSADNTVFLDFEIARVNFFRGLPEAEARRFYAKTTPEPIDTFAEPAHTRVTDLDIPVRYIGFTRDAAVRPERAAGFARKAGVAIETMESAHAAMLSDPAELAERLIAGLP